MDDTVPFEIYSPTTYTKFTPSLHICTHYVIFLTGQGARSLTLVREFPSSNPSESKELYHNLVLWFNTGFDLLNRFREWRRSGSQFKLYCFTFTTFCQKSSSWKVWCYGELFVIPSKKRTRLYKKINQNSDWIWTLCDQPKFPLEKILCTSHNALLPIQYFVQVVMWVIGDETHL